MNLLHVATRREWRRWLKAHHRAEREVWLVYYKKHTGKPRLDYEDAVQEALCFGWIDSNVRRLDDERYAEKYVPRRPGSTWSESNLKRARHLIHTGQMTEAGLAALGSALETGPTSRVRTPSKDLSVPRDLERALRANNRAWRTFQGYAPSYRARYLAWINGAKTEATRRKRIAEAVELIERGVKSIIK